jgi:hypothetical protein
MKKQKLHPLAKIAAVSLVGAFPLFGLGDTKAQQVSQMPESSYYAGSAPATLSPVRIGSESKILPPIISGKPITAAPAVQAAKQAGKNLLAPIGSGVKQVKGAYDPNKVARAFSPAKIPVRTQGSSTRNPLPAIQIPAPSSIVSPPAVTSVLQNGGSMMPSAPVISGSLVTQGSMPSVMSSPEPMVASPNYFDAAPVYDSVPMPSVIASGCSDCGGAAGGCDGGCDSCGTGGCYDPKQINCDYGTFGSVSAARRYAYLEFLYLTREDGDITNSNFNPLGEFDFGPGWRITLGQRPDMTQGREFSYFGTAGIEASQTTNDSRNRLDALFSPLGGLVDDDLSAFNDAFRHVQSKETDLHSLEINRVRWGWDVLKSFVGWRYIYMADEYELQSTAFRRDAFGSFLSDSESGRYRMDTINHLLGAHIGAELFYDIGYRFSLSGMSKYGLYANINKVDNFFENDGTVLLNTENNGANLSSTWEVHLMAHYQIRQTARVRFGYNGMFLGNVATVSDNFTPFVSPFTGFSGSSDDDAFVHGLTLGLEIYR